MAEEVIEVIPELTEDTNPGVTSPKVINPDVTNTVVDGLNSEGASQPEKKDEPPVVGQPSSNDQVIVIETVPVVGVQTENKIIPLTDEAQLRKNSESDTKQEDMQSSGDNVPEINSETPLLRQNVSQNEDVTFLDIFGQSIEVAPALPASTFAGQLVPLVAETTAAKIIAGATIPPAIATVVFTLVGSTIFLLNGFIKSEETDFQKYVGEKIASLPAFAAKLYATGGLAFSLYVVCNELGKLYALPSLPIGLAATALGAVAFSLFNKGVNLGMPAEKIVGIASLFLGITLGNFTMEYSAWALKDLLGDAAASLPYWFPAVVAAGIAPLGNTIGQLMKRCGVFSCNEKPVEIKNIQETAASESDSESSTFNCC